MMVMVVMMSYIHVLVYLLHDALLTLFIELELVLCVRGATTHDVDVACEAIIIGLVGREDELIDTLHEISEHLVLQHQCVPLCSC